MVQRACLIPLSLLVIVYYYQSGEGRYDVQVSQVRPFTGLHRQTPSSDLFVMRRKGEDSAMKKVSDVNYMTEGELVCKRHVEEAQRAAEKLVQDCRQGKRDEIPTCFICQMSEDKSEFGPFEVAEDLEIPIKPLSLRHEGNKSVLSLRAGQRIIIQELGEAKIID